MPAGRRRPGPSSGRGYTRSPRRRSVAAAPGRRAARNREVAALATKESDITEDSDGDKISLKQLVIESLEEDKAEDLTVIGLTGKTSIADYMIIASGGSDGTIKLWDTQSRRLIHVFEGHALRIRAIAASADDRIIASASDDGVIRLWETHTGMLKRTLKRPDRIVTSVALSPDGRTVASDDVDRSVTLWDADSGKIVGNLS